MEDKMVTISEKEFKKLCLQTSIEVASDTNEFLISFIGTMVCAKLAAKLFGEDEDSSKSEQQ